MEETKLRATPAARALARRLGVDLSNVIGTGYKGRIHRDDVAGFNFEDKIHISPLARRIAEDNQISLKGIRGSGRNGKIMKDDVIKLISDPELKARLTSDYFAELSATKAPSQTTPKMQNASQQVAGPSVLATSQSQQVGETETVALSQMRKIISKRMAESFYSAHVYANMGSGYD